MKKLRAFFISSKLFKIGNIILQIQTKINIFFYIYICNYINYFLNVIFSIFFLITLSSLDVWTESCRKKTLVDQEIGEIIEVNQITKRAYGQKNFWKVYLLDFLQVLNLIDSKQLDVLIYILENTNLSNNTFIGTYKKIAKEVNTTEKTIATI